MAASYPTSVKSFTALNTGDTIEDTHVEAGYDEITAIENALLSTGLAHVLIPDATANNRDLGSTAKKWRDIHLSGAVNAATLALTGTQTANTVFAGPSSGSAAAPAFRALAAADMPTEAVRVLDRDVLQADVNNTTTETTVYSFSVPANTLGTGRMLRLTTFGDYLNDAGGSFTFTLRVKFGGTTIVGWGTTQVNDANRRNVALNVRIAAGNATNVQRAFADGVVSTPGTDTGHLGEASIFNLRHATLAIDTTSAQTLEVTVQHSAVSVNLGFKMQNVTLELV